MKRIILTIVTVVAITIFWSCTSKQEKMETEISKKYANFRVNVNGKQLSDNEVEGILRNSTSN